MFSKDPFRNTIRVSNSLDPDQAGYFVKPDLGPNCLQRSSAATLVELRANTFRKVCHIRETNHSSGVYKEHYA